MTLIVALVTTRAACSCPCCGVLSYTYRPCFAQSCTFFHRGEAEKIDHKFFEKGQPAIMLGLLPSSSIQASIFSFSVSTHCVITTFFGLTSMLNGVSVYLPSV